MVSINISSCPKYIMVKKQEVSKKETTFHLPKELVMALKMRAVQESKPYSAMVQEAIQEYLSKKTVYK